MLPDPDYVPRGTPDAIGAMMAAQTRLAFSTGDSGAIRWQIWIDLCELEPRRLGGTARLVEGETCQIELRPDAGTEAPTPIVVRREGDDALVMIESGAREPKHLRRIPADGAAGTCNLTGDVRLTLAEGPACVPESLSLSDGRGGRPASGGPPAIDATLRVASIGEPERGVYCLEGATEGRWRFSARLERAADGQVSGSGQIAAVDGDAACAGEFSVAGSWRVSAH